MPNITHGAGRAPGFNITNQDAYMQLASGLTAVAGDVLAVDMTKVDGSLRWYEVRAPVTADYTTASGAQNVQPYMCIARETQATAAGQLLCRFAGEADGLIEDTGLAIGAKLSPKNTLRVLDTLAAAVGTGIRTVAILKEASTTTSQIRRVDFDGITGAFASSMITNTT